MDQRKVFESPAIQYGMGKGRVAMPLDRARKTYIRQLLNAQPRVRLATLPTPLQEASRLSEVLGGPRIYLKRDDMTGVAFGGNKTRNLEFRLAQAASSGVEVLVVGLDIASNSARQTTGAANRLGMETVL